MLCQTESYQWPCKGASLVWQWQKVCQCNRKCTERSLSLWLEVPTQVQITSGPITALPTVKTRTICSLSSWIWRMEYKSQKIQETSRESAVLSNHWTLYFEIFPQSWIWIKRWSPWAEQWITQSRVREKGRDIAPLHHIYTFWQCLAWEQDVFYLEGIERLTLSSGWKQGWMIPFISCTKIVHFSGTQQHNPYLNMSCWEDQG